MYKLIFASSLIILAFCLSCGNASTSRTDSEISGNEKSTGTQKLIEPFDTLFYRKNGHGISKSVLVLKKNDSLILKIDQQSYYLPGSSLTPIVNEKGELNTVLLFDCNRDQNTDVAIAIEDSVMEGESFLFVLFADSAGIHKKEFYYTESDKYDYLIAKNDFIVVNTPTGEIFCCTNTVAVDDGGGTGLKYKVDKYSWQSSSNRLFYSGSKQFSDKVFEKPESALF